MKQKKTYAERLELYNKRMSHFKTKFTPEQLDEFGRGENLRLIPQLLRLWLVLNMNRFIEIDEMMDNTVMPAIEKGILTKKPCDDEDN